MNAWQCESLEGLAGLHWRNLPTPEPKPGEIRVAVRAASLNFPDLLIVQGKYQVKPPLPFVPGAEFSGTVDALGEGVTQFKLGDRVAALGGTGGFGEMACIPARQALPMPSGMPFEDGAAFAFTYGTSYHALMDRGTLQAGETVLVFGAAGGVGTAALQIAKAAGARVIAAVSSDEKVALCLSLGADAAFNLNTQNLRETLKTLTDGRGPDVIYDPVGGDIAEPAFRSIAWRGRYLVVGFAAGGIPALPFNLSLLKGASIVGVFWGDFMRREPRQFGQDWAQLLQWYAAGKVKPSIERSWPMPDLHQAYAHMGSRKVLGKIVMLNGAAAAD